MPKRNLTDRAVEKIKPPTTGQVDHFDSGYPGLALRISYGGRKTWVYFYRFNGKQRRKSLGNYPETGLAEAREKWREMRQSVQAGIEPGRAAQAKNLESDLFESVFEEWIKRDQAGNRTVDEVRRTFARDILPRLGHLKLLDVERRDILELMDAITDRGAKTMARRIHSYLHRMFKWAVGRGYREDNPLADLPKPGKETSRDRVLSDEELRACWKASEEMGWPFGNLFQLLILTGQRRDEVGSIIWKEIDGDTWTIPKERAKNGVAHDVPLSSLAQGIIENLPRIEDSPYIFTTNGQRPVSGFSKAKQRLDAKMLEILNQETGNDQVLPEWRLHDIRRTVASGMARQRINIAVIEKVLNHTSGSFGGIVGVYQRYEFADEKRDALETWGRFVENLVSEAPPSNVVELAETNR